MEKMEAVMGVPAPQQSAYGGMPAMPAMAKEERCRKYGGGVVPHVPCAVPVP